MFTPELPVIPVIQQEEIKMADYSNLNFEKKCEYAKLTQDVKHVAANFF
jgi:hypothetical protein